MRMETLKKCAGAIHDDFYALSTKHVRLSCKQLAEFIKQHDCIIKWKLAETPSFCIQAA